MNIFKNDASKIPSSDAQIVRVDMEELQIGGRKSHLPAQNKSEAMTLAHVPNQGGGIGSK